MISFRKFLSLAIGLIFAIGTASSQETIADVFNEPGFKLERAADRARAVQRIRAIENASLRRASAKARAKGIPMRQVKTDGTVTQIVGLDENDKFLILTTSNANAAISSTANLVDPSPYNLDGTGITVGIWDESSVRGSHTEFLNQAGNASRVAVRDAASTFSSHGTHVGGTIGARGVNAESKGMAPNSFIDTYDWNNDSSEMTAAAGSSPQQFGKINISNHSYGFGRGWVRNSNSRWEWYGTGTDQNAFTSEFGQYNNYSRSWDVIAFNAPYYLIFLAAGNENSNNPSNGNQVDINSSTVTYDSSIHPSGDGVYRGGYENIADQAVSKNLMTIGAANDAVTGGVRNPSASIITGFSSRGPTDDGRIKPDIVANGSTLFSTESSSDDAYSTKSGTSMASPSAAGSAALLVQLYRSRFPGGDMLASTLKGLIIHAATDIGNPGPDYIYGWGLMDTKKAADLIIAHHQHPQHQHLTEDIINPSNPIKTQSFLWDGVSPLRATLSWTDPAGSANNLHDSRDARLVNNLDLKLIAPNGTEHFPFVMPFVGTWTASSMALPAINGVNNTDNIEQVLVNNPSQTGLWQAVVSYRGNLTNNQQRFSLIISGNLGDGGNLFISSITPNSAAVDTTVTVDIIGSSLTTDTDVRLTRSGTPSIVGNSKQVIAPNTLRCQFNLTSAPLGPWNLVATNPNNESRTLSSAFNIQENYGVAVNAPQLSWTSSGNQPWFVQSSTTHDGVSAPQSGPINHSQQSSLATTLVGPGTLTFQWRVSSEAGWDFLRFFLNGNQQSGSLEPISGITGWTFQTVAIPAGTHAVEWRYTKDDSVVVGSDAAWIDVVSYSVGSSPDIAVEQPAGNSLSSSTSTIDFSSIAIGENAVRNFTIRNTGNTDLTGLVVSSTGTHSSNFSLGTLASTILAPGATTSFDVTFAPTAAGARTALLQISSNDPDENPFTIGLDGVGIPLGTLAVNPEGGLASIGNIGGSLTPSSISYTLINTGSTSLNWTAAKTQTWVTLSSTSGTLAPNATTAVTVSIDNAANSFPAGTYNDIVTFTNTTNNLGNSTRPVALYINTPPVVNAGLDQTIYLTSSAWSPSSLSPGIWLDAADAATLTLNGSFTSQWADKSGNNRHATQSTAANQPIATPAGLNGKNTVTFDGSNDFYNIDLNFIAGQSHSAFIVTNPTAFGNIYGAATGSQSANSLHIGFNGNNYRMNFWGNDFGPVRSSNFVVGSANILNYIWNQGVGKQILANGKSEGTNTNAGVIGTMAGGGRIGHTTTGNHSPFGGDIAEIIIATGSHTLQKREETEGYLAHKWGLTNHLAANHPYKTESPISSQAGANLSGSAIDPDGHTLTTTWSLVNGPSALAISNPSSFTTTATFTAPGIYTLRLSVSDSFTTVTDDVIITVNLTPYQLWAVANGHTFALDPNGDVDSDGVFNQQEFAHGMNPNVSSTGPVTFNAETNTIISPGTSIVWLQSNSPLTNDYRAVFARRKDYQAAGLVYTVEFSPDLNDWYSVNTEPSVMANQGNAEIDVVNIPFPNVIQTNLGFRKPLYFRVGVSFAP